MSDEKKEAMNFLSNGIEELSMQCFKIVRELCDDRLNLIGAVMGEMQEIVAANRRMQTLGRIDSGRKQLAQDAKSEDAK